MVELADHSVLEVREIYLPEPEPCLLKSARKSGVWGVKEMSGSIVRKTIVKRTDGTYTTLHVDAVWPLGNGKTHRREFRSDGSLLGDVWQTWRLVRGEENG